MPFKKEIERKWIMKSTPILPRIGAMVIRQGYILAEDNYEIRIRAKYDMDTYYSIVPKLQDCRLTIKTGNGLSRDEAEVKLSTKNCQELMAAVKGPPIEKFHYKFDSLDGHVIEFSVVDPCLDDTIMYAEVEFESEEEANAWVPPVEFTEAVEREVTGDDFYQLKNYWRRTRNPR